MKELCRYLSLTFLSDEKLLDGLMGKSQEHGGSACGVFVTDLRVIFLPSVSGSGATSDSVWWEDVAGVSFGLYDHRLSVHGGARFAVGVMFESGTVIRFDSAEFEAFVRRLQTRIGALKKGRFSAGQKGAIQEAILHDSGSTPSPP